VRKGMVLVAVYAADYCIKISADAHMIASRTWAQI